MTALTLAAVLGALPAEAQTRQPNAQTARVLAAARTPAAAQPIRDAIRTASAGHRPEVVTAPAPPPNGCGNRVVLGGAIGGGAGAVLGFGLLYGAGGSDSAGRVVASVAALGAVLGALGGLVACGP
ncbi:MAG: hypothetical protein IT181_23425 [Acidobacteria bacterium]|nr:hypothetical protein [Acidobacteriota bacterium]